MNINLFENITIDGAIIGAATILIIMFGRYACIKGEFWFTKKIWTAFLLVGISSVFFSLFIEQIVLSAILSIFGFTFLWGIHEVIEQEERVNKGWFPNNPKRK